MPYLPLRPCRYSGCIRLVHGGYCEQHQHIIDDQKRAKENQYNKQRPTWHKLYDRKWRGYTKIYLAKHPYCVECLKNNKHTTAEEVDHIVPHKGDLNLFWDQKNHQGLCKKCHSKKTARENGWSRRSPHPQKV